jgi:hypothetical protein
MRLHVLGTDVAGQLTMRWKQLLERWVETMAGNWREQIGTLDARKWRQSDN